MTICRGLNIKIRWRRVLDMFHLPRFGEEILSIAGYFYVTKPCPPGFIFRKDSAGKKMPGHNDHPLPGCFRSPMYPRYSNIANIY